MRSRLRAAKQLLWRALVAVRRTPALAPVTTPLVAARNRRRYRAWFQTYGELSATRRAEVRAEIAAMAQPPTISVVMPVYETPPALLNAAIRSVRDQLYPHWQLCISDDASKSPAVRQVLERHAAEEPRIRLHVREARGHISANSNDALRLATGDYVALLDADDLLTEAALFAVAREIVRDPTVEILFSDEDKLDAKGRLHDPTFKSDWNPALMLAQNAVSHLGVYRRSLVERAGGFREGFEGAQDHDLVLRCSRLTTHDRIRHLPFVLYHWREVEGSTAAGAAQKPYAVEAGRRAVAGHLAALGVEATLLSAPNHWLQVDYPAQALPGVTVVIPTTAGALFHRCAETLFRLTAYPDLEVLALVAEKHLAALSADPHTASLIADGRLTSVSYPDEPFNYSRVNNLGVARARGDLVCLLNDDIEITDPLWLQRLAVRAAMPGVGAVGPRLLYPDGKVQHAGVGLGIGGQTEGEGVAAHLFAGRPASYLGPGGRAALEQDLSCVTAACLVTRKAVFDQVGGLDEALPVAFNDVDFCIKVRQAGYRILWTPQVTLTHHESASFGAHNAPARQDQFARDCALMRQRWGGLLDDDPFYSPNYSLVAPFTLASPPRRRL
jgi:GT2 family glycosyltransferase